MPCALSLLCPHPSIGSHDLLSAETIHGVIVHHPSGLHIGIAHRGAHKCKPSLAQVLAHRLGCCTGRWVIAQRADGMHHRLAINKPPQIGSDTAEGLLDLEKPPGIMDGGTYFLPMADNPR